MKYKFLVHFLFLFFISFTFAGYSQELKEIPEQLGHGYEFEGNGKDMRAGKQSELYLPWSDFTGLYAGITTGDNKLINALDVQREYLQSKKRVHRFGNLSFNDAKLLRTINKLSKAIIKNEIDPDIRLYRIKGEDGKGNVHFTAYFTPVLEVRKERDEIFKFPIYRKPDNWEGNRPTREMIDHLGVLEGKGLELAWSSDLLDNYFLQVQGSGYLKFPDLTIKTIVFNGQNGYAYTSIGKYMVAQGYIKPENISLPSIRKWIEQHPDSLSGILNRNKSYTFFSFSNEKPAGAAGTELISSHSIAVDPSYIPYGAVLLAKVPVLNEDGDFVYHEYRLMTAQDRGGAIAGPGHVDLYEGVGEEAMLKAGSLHHYGTLWLILSE